MKWDGEGSEGDVEGCSWDRRVCVGWVDCVWIYHTIYGAVYVYVYYSRIVGYEVVEIEDG